MDRRFASPAAGDIDLNDLPPRRVLYSEGDEEAPGETGGEGIDPPGSRVRYTAEDGFSRATAAASRSAEGVLATPAQVAAEKRLAFDRASQHLQRLAGNRRPQQSSEWLRRPLSDLPVCIIDLETTGGSQDSDEILEVGAVLLRGREFVREFASLVDPQRPITRAAHLVHRITHTDISGAPRIEELLPWLRQLSDLRVLLFHNAGFDLGFLQRAFREAGQEPLQQPVIDTVVVARRLLGGRCALGVLGQRLAIDLPHAHRALADARLTAQVWLELVEVLEEAGATTLGQVPGVIGRARLQARRRRPRHTQLLELFESAIASQQALELAYRAGRGMEPLVMQVLPQRLLHNRFCRVVDLDSLCEKDLYLDRIDRCGPAL